LAHPQVLGASHRDRRGHGVARLEHGQVGQHVEADNVDLHGGAIGERRFGAVGPGDDVGAGQQVAVGRDDAGAAAALAAPGAHREAGNAGQHGAGHRGDHGRVRVQCLLVVG
jgi:hypothetical protein